MTLGSGKGVAGQGHKILKQGVSSCDTCLGKLESQTTRSQVNGDFNMVKWPQDKSSFCSRFISGGEKLSWEELNVQLQLSDPFKFKGRL